MPTDVRALPASAADRTLGTRRFESTVHGWTFVVTVEPESRALLRDMASQADAGRQHHGPVVVRAPLPGRIARSWVAVGDTVEAGQRLLAIEAMKMENEVRAPRAGVVASIAVTAGSSVELGDELVTVR
jgi:biotin carboxyl carrier protein